MLNAGRLSAGFGGRREGVWEEEVEELDREAEARVWPRPLAEGRGGGGMELVVEELVAMDEARMERVRDKDEVVEERE